MNQRENQKPFISKGQTTQWPKENEPKGESEAFHQQRTDNTMTKRKLAKGRIRSLSSVKDRQHNDQKKMNQRENQKPFISEGQPTQ